MAAASRAFLPGVTLCQPVTIGASKLLARERTRASRAAAVTHDSLDCGLFACM